MANIKNNKKSQEIKGFVVSASMPKQGQIYELEKYRSELIKCANDIRSNYVKIGTLLLKVKSEKLIITTDGWQNFITQTLDMSVPTAYRIMSTVEKFYAPKSLETDPEIIAKLDGFKDSTISRLLPLGDYETIKSAILDGTFNSDMSAREVTEKVGKMIEPKKKNVKAKNVPSENTVEAASEEESITTEAINTKEPSENRIPNSGETANFDAEVFKLVNEMIAATALVEVQNLGKAFLDRWFKK